MKGGSDVIGCTHATGQWSKEGRRRCGRLGRNEVAMLSAVEIDRKIQTAMKKKYNKIIQ